MKSFFKGNKRFLPLALLAAAATGAVSRRADASLTLSLQFSDGSTTKAAAVGNYTIDVYATVSTDASTDSLTRSFFSLSTTKAASGNGAIATGGFTSGGPASPFNANGFQAGKLQDFSLDGLTDIGTASTTSTSADNAQARAAAAVKNSDNGGSSRFLIGEYTFNIASVSELTGTSTISVVAPKGSSVALSGTIWAEAGVAKNSFSSSTSFFTGDGVTFTAAPAPEPASLSLVGLGGLALLARRRRQLV